jgi:RHS repeat-associated protein
MQMSRWTANRAAGAIRRLYQRCLAAAGASALVAISAVHADPQTGVDVTVPNGFLNVTLDDLTVQTTGGAVRWGRHWDGQEWKFNPYWESLSQSWKNLTGSQTADTTGSALTSGGSSTPTASLASSGGSTDDGCWVWVDEDWQPSQGTTTIGGVPQAGPMAPERTTPFNRLMGDDAADYSPPQIVSIDYASLCVGAIASTGVKDVEGIRRENELYLGGQGRYAFNNRAVLEKRPVQSLPSASAAALYGQLASGSVAAAPVQNPKGYRWIHKDGDWIDYNTQGQIVAYGDKNNNIIWLARDTSGIVRGVVDANGRVLYSLHYTGALVTEVRDYPIAGNSLDLPARSVKYTYDNLNRLTVVTDALGNTTRYDYDGQNHIVKVTDQEGHVDQFAYNGDVVSKRTAPDGAVTDYVFEYDDSNKQFASTITGPETSAGRRKEDYTHNRSGQLVRRIVNGRIDQEVRYDTASRVEQHTNARGFATRIAHNEFDQTVEIGLPDGTSVKHTYSALNLQVTEDTDELGIKTQYQYDSQGNLLKKTEAVGTADQRVTDFEVNALGQLTKMTRRGRTEANGTVTADAVWQVDYDAQGQISKTTDPEGGVRQYVDDRAGNLVQYVDPLSNTTRYQVDAAGSLIKATDVLGRVQSYVYDKVGNPTGFIDARGKATQAAFDAMNRNTQITNPVGGTYRAQYNGQGQKIAETDEDGRTTQSDYDAFLLLAKDSDALGNTTTFGYQIPDGTNSGALGALYSPTEIAYPTYTERHRYDQLERETTQTLLNPGGTGTEGLVSSKTYDARGRIKSETNENGKTRYYAYDSLGNLNELTDSLGNKTRAQYDARGNLLQITDANGHVNRFEYDRYDRVVKEVLPLGQATTYQYDAAGNVKQYADPNNNRTTYTYDAANRLKEVRQYNSAGALIRTTSLTWDNADNITAWNDTDATRPSEQQTASASTAYDDYNRKTSETVTYPSPAGGTYSLTYGYSYSAAGLTTTLTWPDSTLINYSYSDHGELAGVDIPGEGSISVNQYKWVAPTLVTLPGGSTQARTYDGLLNLTGLKVKTPGQQTVLDAANAYGKVQELQSSTRTDAANGLSSTRSNTYTFDDEVRLTQFTADSGGASGTDTETYVLDAVGNRIAYNRVSGAWTYDANNRLLQKGTGTNATTYGYDEAGNLTQKTEPGNRVTQYSYDSQNRLVGVRDGSGDLIARYGYDPLDQRIWKEQYRDFSGNPLAQAKRTYYLYCDEGLVAEAEQAITLNADGTVSAASAPQITTEYGVQPDSDFTTDVLFVKTRNTNGQVTVAYYQNDQLGTPVQAIDKAGNLVWAASYDVFGRATITTPAATADKPTITSNLRLPGQYADEETGLHYNDRRYYDPDTGRYITQDPIGLAGGGNLYRYADADPAGVVDPTGEIVPAVAVAVDAAIVYGRCVLSCMLETAAANAITGECNNWGTNAKECAVGCLAGGLLGKAWKWGKNLWDRLPCAINSFPRDTLVHVRPANARANDALAGASDLQPIADLHVGDEVLAYSEWQDQGTATDLDGRLSYQKVTNIYSSVKEQTLVHLTLDDGQKITATDGHPFMTTDGWRDAVLLKRGGQLLLKGAGGDSDHVAHVATIVDVEIENQTLPAFNLEVANGHTFFVGADGELVHNGCRKFHWHHSFPKYLGGAAKQKLTRLSERLHKLYHQGLDKVAPRWRGKDYYDNLPKPQKNQVLNDVKNFTDNFDQQHGTDLLNQARQNGFPKK